MDGSSLSVWWALPFCGMLLSIAMMPLVAPHFWHRHDAAVTAFWSLAFLLPLTVQAGIAGVGHEVVHVLLAEYLPFILLLTALFTVAGGIHIRGNLHGSPGLNTGLLGLGAALASVMGTTGASMLLVRPLIRANDDRRHKVHTLVFFIFIVSNIGGSLTPLGDPPLFLGFLQGVDFSWTLKNILWETLFMLAVLLPLFYGIDRYWYAKEGARLPDPTPDTAKSGFGIDGAFNFVWLAVVIALVLLSGLWKTDAAVDLWGTRIGLPGLVRDIGLLCVIVLSLKSTSAQVHHDNQFTWGPMREVAVLFAGIFLTIAPVIAMLKAGTGGPFGAVIAAVTGPDGQPDPARYFWATGLLSSFLDNAPTYLVFFNTAGGNAQTLMTTHAATLAAISAGAVFMGANTYIGNAPNLMVKAIAESRGVRMPGFFGYMAWSGTILIPLFLLTSFIFFRRA